MSITYRVDVEHKVVLATAEGVVLADADLLVHLERLTTDTEVQSGFDELYNLRGVMEVEITASSAEDVADFIHEIEQHFKESKRTALVASDHNTAEVSYLYELLRTNVPATVRLFGDMEAARAWLGLPDARSELRNQVEIAVLCRTDTQEASACVVAISLSGASLESMLLKPKRDTMVTIQFPSFEVFGRVLRHTENGFAVEFLRTEDDLAEMLRNL